MTDGVPTAGETDASRLSGKLETLRGAGVQRVDAIAVGGIRDDGVLRKITHGSMPKDGAVLDAQSGPDEVARRLALSTTSKLPIKVEGASFWYPKTVDGLQPGDEVLVYAELSSEGGKGSPTVTVGDGKPQALTLRSAPQPLVERAFAQAKIASLVEAGGDENKAEIVRLSTTHRVLSPHTALLVLETDVDYRRFGIDRTAKLDILTVDDGRVAVKHSSRFGEPSDDDEAKEKNAGPTTGDSRDRKAGGTGTRARGEEGRMGANADPAPPPPGALATATAAAPPTDNAAAPLTTPTIAERPDVPQGGTRARALREAQEFGMIGSLSASDQPSQGQAAATTAPMASGAPAPRRAAAPRAIEDGDTLDGFGNGLGHGGGGRVGPGASRPAPRAEPTNRPQGYYRVRSP